MTDYAFIESRDGKKMNRIIFEEPYWNRFVSDTGNWQEFQRKPYQVKIEKAFPDKIYNVPEKPGVVYNILEDCEESILKADYVVTGLMGEMWLISCKDLCGYEVNEVEIEVTPKLVYTKSGDRTYYGVRIPLDTAFSVETLKYGKLKGNANQDRVPHGEGDYIICTSFDAGDFRIVNGQIFHKMYELRK